MPSFSRDDLERSVIGSAFNPQSTHSFQSVEEVTRVGRRKKDRRRTAEDTAKLIKKFLVKQGKWVTLLDICDHLDRAPGPHLRRILDTMIEAGEVERDQDLGAGPSIPRHLYRAAK
jgi:CTP-dependent riboflavin kinase